MSGMLYNSNRAHPPSGIKIIEENEKWYWIDNIEVPNGPFDTRYEAIQAAWADQDLDLDDDNY